MRNWGGSDETTKRDHTARRPYLPPRTRPTSSGVGWPLSLARITPGSASDPTPTGVVPVGASTADQSHLRGPNWRGRRRCLVWSVCAEPTSSNCSRCFDGGREDCDLVYSRSAPFNPATQWGLVTNSPYLTEAAVNIIPVFVTDNMVSVPEIPTNIYFQPLITADSFHLGGRTDCENYVMTNERYITLSAWNDERDILTTLTHELLHNQDGNFCNTPVPLPEGCVIISEGGRRYYSCEHGAVPALNEWLENRSVRVESHTASGTVEALAAQCSAGSGLACASFWDNIKGLASGSLRTELNGIGLWGLFDPFLDLFVRSRTESRQADKSMRDYTINGPEGYKQRMEIIAKYYAMPWNVYVVPGIANGALLDTGNLTRVMIPGGEKIYLVVLGMPYDDSQLMFGPVGRMFLRAMTIGSLPGSFSVGGELPSQIPELLDGRLLFPINSLDKVASH